MGYSGINGKLKQTTIFPEAQLGVFLSAPRFNSVQVSRHAEQTPIIISWVYIGQA